RTGTTHRYHAYYKVRSRCDKECVPVEDFCGRMLGRYQVEALIAHGGMAAVYRATDPSFGRTVAIKVIKPEMADDEQFIRRFLREARSIARLQHPHILPVYDVGEQGGVVYLVMQYVDG